MKTTRNNQKLFMKKFTSHFLLLFSIVFVNIFSACSPAQKKETQTNVADSVTEYAKGFSINYFDNYKQVIVHSPWEKGTEYARYYLVENDTVLVPSDGVKVKAPLSSLASSSVTHFEFLHLLGELETVIGICTPNLVYNARIKEKVANGMITDLGDSFKINVEKTLLLYPAALMVSGYNQTDANIQRVAQAKIPIIYNNEWMESSLLGRAEWIKFIAAFYNKEAEADSIFTEIANRYNEIKAKAAEISDKPSVMAGSNFRGTWYMPSGNSFMGHLFADAGTNYFYADNSAAESLPLNVETVLKNFSKSDVWLNCNYSTLDDLLKADTKHRLFRPVKQNEVYNFHKRLLLSGANDFWESAVARPDLLLADVIAILHPAILPNHELVYADKLK